MCYNSYSTAERKEKEMADNKKGIRKYAVNKTNRDFEAGMEQIVGGGVQGATGQTRRRGRHENSYPKSAER